MLPPLNLSNTTTSREHLPTFTSENPPSAPPLSTLEQISNRNATPSGEATVPDTLLFDLKVSHILKQLSQDSFLADFYVSVQNTCFKCHKAIISGHSSRLDALISRGDGGFCLDTGLSDCQQIVKHLLSSLYGVELKIDSSNSGELMILSYELDISAVCNYVMNSLKTRTDSFFSINVAEIMEKLNHYEKDCHLVYKNVHIEGHKFLHGSLSPLLRRMFSQGTRVNDKKTSLDFSKSLEIHPECFKHLFESVYQGQVEINLLSMYDYWKLSSVLEMDELKCFIEKWVHNQESSSYHLFPAITKANNAADLGFLSIMSSKISTIPSLSSEEPLQLSPTVCSHLLDCKIDSAWILNCAVTSYETQGWTSVYLNSILEKIVIKSIPPAVILETIDPLLDQTELFTIIVKFSIKNLDFFLSQMPIKWLQWIIVTVNTLGEAEQMKTVANLIDRSVAPSTTNLVTIQSLSPDFLRIIMSTIKYPHNILLFMKISVCTHYSEGLTAAFFSELLNSIDLSLIKAEVVFCCLKPLMESNHLNDVVCLFVAKSLMPKLLEECRNSTRKHR
ncbi:hypothetical protein RCL1_005347 [Eukaryota sp. TZLM3-RCL]